jgi:hypothetical protein
MIPMSKRLNRRALLRGAIAGGSVAIGLPFLEAMMPRGAAAQSSGAPKRIVFWFTANGTRQDLWSPPASMDLTDHPLHASLAPLSNKLVFIDGVDQTMAYNSIGDGHQTGMACLLTNAPILPGTLFCEEGCEAGMESYVGWGGGISIDQYLANAIEEDVITKFRSLELGVQVRSASVWSRMSYSAPDQPVPPRENPGQNFVDFFSDLETDPLALEILRRKRQSVLDVVLGDYQRFNMRLGAADRIRLDQHLEAIRAVEKRINAVGFGEACEEPTVTIPGEEEYQQNDAYPDTGRAQMDLLVMALACDMTRVASLQWSGAVSNVRMTWLPLALAEGHHDLSHYDDSDANSQGDLQLINRWYSDQFAYLISAMDAIPEGDGSLLDHSVVVWVNELGKGNSHTRDDIPFLLAGGCSGAIETGRLLSYDGEPHGKLLVSLAQAMDKPVATFGDPEFSQGPLSGLV